MSAVVETIYRRSLSVAIKTKVGPVYGQGFNYWVEVCVANANVSTEAKVLRALARLDHQSLGVDVKFEFEPSTAALVQWLYQGLYAELNAHAEKLREVRWIRGDGFSVVISCSPSTAE